jgi:hypothetical protein
MAMTPPSSSVLSSVGAVSEGITRAPKLHADSYPNVGQETPHS